MIQGNNVCCTCVFLFSCHRFPEEHLTYLPSTLQLGGSNLNWHSPPVGLHNEDALYI